MQIKSEKKPQKSKSLITLIIALSMVNNHAILLVLLSEVYLELNQTSTMELFVKIGNG